MNFQKQVLERSEEVPVVVDFWAPWCGPCRTLGPMIEELATEADGKWELLKINTEDHPQTAQEYGIRSIPAVKMFFKGEIIAQFSGALPKNQIENWLDENLPDEKKDRLTELIQNFENGESNGEELLDFYRQNPQLKGATRAAIRVLATMDLEEAKLLTADLQPTRDNIDLKNQVETLDELLHFHNGDSSEAGLKLLSAAEALKRQDPENLMRLLVETVMINKNLQNELPRRAAIAAFGILGNSHPIVKKFRRRFDMALY